MTSQCGGPRRAGHASFEGIDSRPILQVTTPAGCAVKQELVFFLLSVIRNLLLTPCLLLLSLGLYQARATSPLVIGLVSIAMIGSAFAEDTPPTCITNDGDPCVNDDAIYNLGAVFYTSEPICITGVRFYAPSAGNYPTHLWNDNDTSCPSGSFLAAKDVTASIRGWTSSEFDNGVLMTVNDRFVA